MTPNPKAIVEGLMLPHSGIQDYYLQLLFLRRLNPSYAAGINALMNAFVPANEPTLLNPQER